MTAALYPDNELTITFLIYRNMFMWAIKMVSFWLDMYNIPSD